MVGAFKFMVIWWYDVYVRFYVQKKLLKSSQTYQERNYWEPWNVSFTLPKTFNKKSHCSLGKKFQQSFSLSVSLSIYIYVYVCIGKWMVGWLVGWLVGRVLWHINLGKMEVNPMGCKSIKNQKILSSEYLFFHIFTFTYIYIYMHIFTNLSTREGYDTRSIFLSGI